MSRVLPILFNTEMVRAILDGRKNTTRRPIKKSQCDLLFKKDPAYIKWDELREPWHSMTCEEYIKSSYTCPCQPGDTLYVRESWGTYNRNWCESDYFMYRADYPDGATTYTHNDGIICDLPKWHPSIYMPKDAARIWLKVKDVRVERLQDITEEQAKAEGIREYSKDGKLWKYAVTDDWWISYHHKYRKFFVGSWWQDMPRTAKEAFHHLWNSTLGRRDTPEWYANNWSGNPWVWVIEFERCEKLEGWRV